MIKLRPTGKGRELRALFPRFLLALRDCSEQNRLVKHWPKRLLVVVLAVERFRLARGALPNTLDKLLLAYLEAVPQDPFDGQPLRYKKLPKGYVVYSVGEDGKDDGGAERDANGRQFVEGTDITFTVER